MCLIRFLCSFLSGFLIWSSNTPSGEGAVLYSLGYNASYMIPETVITAAAAILLYRFAPALYYPAETKRAAKAES